MKYTIEERLDIGHRVCEREKTINEASAFYHVSVSAIVSYMRLYRVSSGEAVVGKSVTAHSKADYEGMSKDQLIQQLMLKDIEVARAKKGYEVKGDGIKKAYVSLSKRIRSSPGIVGKMAGEWHVPTHDNQPIGLL